MVMSQHDGCRIAVSIEAALGLVQLLAERRACRICHDLLQIRDAATSLRRYAAGRTSVLYTWIPRRSWRDAHYPFAYCASPVAIGVRPRGRSKARPRTVNRRSVDG